MIYFVFALIALVCWSGSDLFSKKGTVQKDNSSHWRVIFAVGAIMGLHAIITLIVTYFAGDKLLELDNAFLLSFFYTDFKPMDFLYYLPVAFLYLLAMVIGYVGLRYIELSISSPICNASGSLALLLIAILGAFGVFSEPVSLGVFEIIAVVLITFGIIWLGYVEYHEDDEIKKIRTQGKDFKYTSSLIAILIPIIYLFLDAIATVGDEIVYDLEIFVSDYSANTAFEFTSLCFAIFAFIWVKFVKKQAFFKINKEEVLEDGTIVKKAVPFSKFLIIGGVCETIGQIFYMAVVASPYVQFLPMISSYCVLSVVWSRLFLKEKLSIKHYIAIFATLIGIVLLAILTE
ncbi:MAG: hypothetical protein IKV61_05925 [Clostridia bacterium]|nr:hypothetical protein [Clostridia bacterium]